MNSGTAHHAAARHGRHHGTPSRSCCALAFLAPLILAGVAAAFPPAPQVLWTFPGINDICTFAWLPDANGDGVPDILVETYDAGAVGDHTYLLSGGDTGTPGVIWSQRPSSGVSNGGGYGDDCLISCPDLSGDGFPDVLLGTAWGNRSVHAFNGLSGDVLWTFDTYTEYESGWIYSVAWLPDRTGDGVPEVAFGAGSDNNLGYLLDGAAGSVLWRFYGSSDAIGVTRVLPDVNGDGVADVIFGGMDYEYHVFCVSGGSTSYGAQIWATDTGNSTHGACVIEDVDLDGIADVVVGNWSAANQVQCLSGVDGHVLWTFDNGSYNYIMRLVNVGDVNQDDYDDVAVGSWDRAVRVVNGKTGDLVWQSWVGTLNGGDCWSVDRVDDLTGDGVAEVVGGSFDYNTYLFDGADGDTLWIFNTGYRLYTVRGVPDISGNGAPDVMAGTQYISAGGLAFALEGRDVLSAAGDLPRVRGQATFAGGNVPQVELAWTCDQELAFRIYRYDTGSGEAQDKSGGRSSGRTYLAEAFASGQLRSREVLQSILAEETPRAELLTPEPVEPVEAGAGLWHYAFTDRLPAGADPGRYLYRLTAVLPDGRELPTGDLTPVAGSGPRLLPQPLIQQAALQPNPFNPRTTVCFTLTREATVSLVIHDLRGRRVASLPPAHCAAGEHRLPLAAVDAEGRSLPAGVYMLVLKADGERRTLRATLVR
jgi:WD40 repeat protein